MKAIVILIAALFTISCSAATSTTDNDSISTVNNGSGIMEATAGKMKITIGTAVFAATLYNNASANEFKARLPLTIDMTELNGKEKYFDFSSPLPTDASVGGAIKAGDLMLYTNNVLVLFYKNFNTSYSYTRLGVVDDPAGLADALGAGNVVAKFEKN